jgi:hypothetical protein
MAPPAKVYGKIGKTYTQRSIRDRIRAFLLDNVGKVVTRGQNLQVARDPNTGEEPENWHQRLSVLRTDEGYTILTARDNAELRVGEYMLKSAQRRSGAGRRIVPTDATWQKVLQRANNRCQWNDDGIPCGLAEGDQDQVGGGTVELTRDHLTPHSINPNSDPNDPTKWRALCGRHQVMKKNYWDSLTGKINVIAIVQAASKKEKKEVYEFLKGYFDSN